MSASLHHTRTPSPRKSPVNVHPAPTSANPATGGRPPPTPAHGSRPTISNTQRGAAAPPAGLGSNCSFSMRCTWAQGR